MKFDTIDEFLAYYYSNNINLADVDFSMPEMADVEAGDPAATPDVLEEPPAEVPEEPTGEKLVETAILRLASGDLHVTLDKDGYVLVDNWEMTPNACGTGSLVIEGRHLHLNMCDMDGTTVAYFHTTNGLNQPLKIRTKI